MGVTSKELMSLLVILLVVCFFPVVVSAAEADNKAPMNPAFIEYMQEKSQAQQLSGLNESEVKSLGLVPEPVLHLNAADVHLFAEPDSAYPARFDLRTIDKVTSVKDQGDFGTCWAHAALASLESGYLPNETNNFSEKNMANLAGFDYAIPDGGGNTAMAEAYLLRWNGPVNETTDPYPTGNWTSSLNYPPVKHVQNCYDIPPRTSYTDVGNIKGSLTTWGAVDSSFFWNRSCYSTVNFSYYQPETSPDSGVNTGGHAVTIVGWDDNFPAGNFTPLPTGHGAWIVKNSWGESWGDHGYFYISYYDKYFGSKIQGVKYRDTSIFIGDQRNDYRDIYQYDPLGHVRDLWYGQKKTGLFANVFTCLSGGLLKAVGFYTTDVNTVYQVDVYRNPTNGPIGGIPVISLNGSLANMGYHTIQIPVEKQVALVSGDNFSVVVNVTNPVYDYNVAVECPYAGYSSNATAYPGQSYVSANGTVFNDLFYEFSGYNMSACIKAYVSANPTPTPVPVVTGISPSAGQAGTTVPFIISGTNLSSGIVNLSHSGQSNISTSGILSGINITGTFILPPDALAGPWNVSVNQGGIFSNSNILFNITTLPVPPLVSRITPSTGMIGTTVGFTIDGNNFINGANVTLVHSNSTNITATGVSVISPRDIRGNFTLVSGTATGNWTVVVDQGGLYSTDNVTFLVTEPLKSYQLSVSSDSLGWIEPSGNITVFEGQDQTFRVHPGNGAEIKNLTVDGIERIINPNLTFSMDNITSDHQIRFNCQSLRDVVIPGFNATYTSDPMTVQFNDTSVARPEVISWQWSFGDTNQSSEQNPGHTYTNPGTYMVGLWARNNMTQSYVEGPVTVPHQGSGFFSVQYRQ